MGHLALKAVSSTSLIHPITHTFFLYQNSLSNIYTHSSGCIRWQLGVQYLAQRNFDLQTRGHRDRHILPPEPQPTQAIKPCSNVLGKTLTPPKVKASEDQKVLHKCQPCGCSSGGREGHPLCCSLHAKQATARYWTQSCSPFHLLEFDCQIERT